MRRFDAPHRWTEATRCGGMERERGIIGSVKKSSRGLWTFAIVAAGIITLEDSGLGTESSRHRRDCGGNKMVETT